MRWKNVSMLMLSLPIIVSGCGGGGGSAPSAGIEGSGLHITSSGAVTGKGSIFVNGVEYDLHGATITVDGDPATEADLDVGGIVIVEGELDAGGSTGNATRVTAGIAVAGRISAVDRALERVTILGQTVVIDARTRIVDGDDNEPLGGLAVGDDVEVTGFADSTGILSARRIATRKAGTPLRVTGYADDVDTANHRFTINGHPVIYTSATLHDLTEATLSGAPIRVDADDIDAQGALLATHVVYRDPALPGAVGNLAALQGWVTRYTSDSDFAVDGHPVVTTPDTKVEGTTGVYLGHIRLDAFVSVRGKLISGGVVEAALVETNNVVALDSVITRLDPTTRFIDAALVPWAGPGCTVTPETAITIDGRPADFGSLRIGDVADIHAHFGTAGSTCQIIAVQHNVRGPLESKPTTSGSFTVMGQRVWFDSAYPDQGFGKLDDLKVGDLVEVSGHTTATGDILATAVHQATAVPDYQAIGFAHAVDNLAGRFALGSLVIDYAGAEVGGFPNGAPSEGDRVLVTAASAPSGGVLDANLVRYAASNPRGSMMNFVNPVGVITRYVSPEDLDIEGRHLVRLPDQVGVDISDQSKSIWIGGYCDFGKLHRDLRATFLSVGGPYGRPLYWTAQCPRGRTRDLYGVNFGSSAPLELASAVEYIDLVNRSVRVMGVNLMLQPATLLTRLRADPEGGTTTTPAFLEDLVVGERAWVRVRGNPADGIRIVDEIWLGYDETGETIDADLQSLAYPEMVLYGGVRVRVTAATALEPLGNCEPTAYDVAQFFARAPLGSRLKVSVVRDGDNLVAGSIQWDDRNGCTIAVDAGPDQTVVSGALVHLRGTWSSDSVSLFYLQWSQKAGPTVDLDQDWRDGTASFIAPAVSENSDLVFEFAVAEDIYEGSGYGYDTVTIHVSPNQ